MLTMTATSPVRSKAALSPRARPKILHVLEATSFGTAAYVADLLLHADTTSFDLSLAYSPFRTDARFRKDLERVAARGIRIYEIPMHRNIHALADAKAFVQIYRLIKTHGFDIVHGHSSKAGFLARLAAKLASHTIATVYSPHAIAISVHRKYWYLERFAGLFTDVVLGVSRSEREELQAYRFIRPAKLRYVTAGIDLLAYSGFFGGQELRRRIGVAPGTVLIGSAGRITGQKDPVTFLQVAAALLSKGAPAHFIWAGDGELKEACEKLAAELGIARHVTYLGYLPDLRPFLDAVDIFALTSRYESFGYVSCEAMAMGKPVVATRVSGSRELVRDAVTGYLIDVADVQGFAKALGRLAGDPELRRRMGEAGHARAQEHYDLPRMVRGVEQIYWELFSAGRELAGERSAARMAAWETNQP